MDNRTQDALERLERSNDFAIFLAYVKERRQIYLESLAHSALETPIMARQQGLVLAFDEVLRMPEEARNEKDTRT